MKEDYITQYQKTTKKDWIRTITYFVVFIVVIIIGAIFILPAYWYIWLILIILIMGSLFLLVRWHAKNFTYRCFKCGHEFEISTFVDFISPHGLGKGGGWKYLKCPKCHEKSKATVIKKVKKLDILKFFI